MKQYIWRQSVLLFFALVFLAHPRIAMSESERLHGHNLDDDFKRYPASEMYTGAPVPVVLGTDPRANQFRTRITAGAKHGPNFAGIYTVVEWGCGTNCQQLVVINAGTGHVSDWLTTELGSSYHIDSVLFVKNPDTEECSALEWCKTEYYRFEKGKFRLLK